MNKKVLIALGILLVSIGVFFTIFFINDKNSNQNGNENGSNPEQSENIDKENPDNNEEKPSIHDSELQTLMKDAEQKVIDNYDLVLTNIYDLVKPADAIDGRVYVHRSYDVGFAIKYNDVCYVKEFWDRIYSEKNIETCIEEIENFVKPYLDDEEEEVVANYEDKNFNENKLESKLYLKYIKFSNHDINAYENININNKNSDDYLIKFAIYTILKENNIKISDYFYLNTYDDNVDYEWYAHSRGYKITKQQIEDCLKENFNITRELDYKNADLFFYGNISDYYDEKEQAYRLVDASTIPASGIGSDTYSKFVKAETIGNDIIIYSEYLNFLIADGGTNIQSHIMNDRLTDDYLSNDIEDTSGVINQYKGKFKHTFTKSTDGNYYWVSTEKIN